MKLERVKGIEPSSQPWEGHILPLNHTRLRTAKEPAVFYQTAARLATGLQPPFIAWRRTGGWLRAIFPQSAAGVPAM